MSRALKYQRLQYERYTPLREVNQANVSLVIIDNMSDLGIFPTCLDFWNTKDWNDNKTHLLRSESSTCKLGHNRQHE